MSDETHYEFDVFLSYAREDLPLIQPIVEALTDAGLRVWWDQRINPGAEFDRTIEAALASSKTVVVVWTARSVSSEWVRNEAAEGLRRGVLVPITLDGSEPPLAFRRRQTLTDVDQLPNAVKNIDSQDSAVPYAHVQAPTGSRQLATHLAYLALFGAIALAALFFWPQDAPDPVVQKHTIQLQGYRDPIPYTQGLLAISPNGEYWAYAGSDPTLENPAIKHLYLKRRDESQGRRIASTTGAMSPFFSWDGSRVGYYAQGSLWHMSLEGGRPSEIAKIPGAVMGSAWCEDNHIYFSNGYRAPLRRVSVETGLVETVIELGNGTGAYREPSCLPNNNLALTERNVGGSKVCLYNLVSQRRHCPVQGSRPSYLASDHGLTYFGTGGALWFARLDDDATNFQGDPQIISQEVGADYQISQSNELLWSNNVEYFGRSSEYVTSEMVLVDGQSGVEEWREDIRVPSFARISNSGTHVAVSQLDQARNNIWIYNLDSGTSRQVTFEGGRLPIWSPDDTSIAFWQAGVGIRTLNLSDSSDPVTLVDFPDYVAFANHWTESGILYSLVNQYTNGDLFFRQNDGTTLIIDDAEAATTSGHLSPDRRWIAFSSEEVGHMEVYVREFPNGRQRWQVSMSGGDHPRWARNGSRLYYQSGTDVYYVDMATEQEVSFSQPRKVASVGMPGYWFLNTYDISEDTSKLLLLDYKTTQTPTVTYFQGWESLISATGD